MNTCYLFTAAYPFTDKEAFVHAELPLLAESFEKVIILPLDKITDSVELPNNVEVEYLFNNFSTGNLGFKSKLANFFSWSFILDFISNGLKVVFKPAKFKNYFSQYNQNVNKSFVLETYFAEKVSSGANYFYSYWFDNWATILALYKKRHADFKFISRAHGYEVFPEQSNVGFFALRSLQLKGVSKVFSVSKEGAKMLRRSNFAYASKITHSYLGSKDYGLGKFDNNEVFTIVSCAHVAGIKRIERIGEVLKHIDFPIRWVHFGGYYLDEQEAQTRLLTVTDELKEYKNIRVELLGSKTNAEVMEFYKANTVNLFISLSSTEGIPVTMMEAISFGIPVLSTNVGGCSEIVTEDSGILVSKEESVEEIANKIKEFRLGKWNTKLYRNTVRLFWSENFHQENNFRKFIKEITTIFN